ncbi:O-antigen polymerase [Proteiniclasticum sp. QWL-01]|uniref:O-antigen polymerase n=1 Tax=Proteiniclasticum sp. QWL-01 TaxID=3036945 RepID=UPI0024116C17|nr:O-antigen polymerase [Proteiniclasticum sp. QWL-01]WFF74408.1 O-antigen ligase [Proteiniclasticum sp. QWL-01]
MKKSTPLIIFLIIIIFNAISLFSSLSINDSVLLINFYVNLFTLDLMLLVVLFLFYKYKVSIFDPVVFILTIYILMFIVTPIYDILNNKILWFGVNLFKYGVKGTLIALLGFCGFIFGYFITYKYKPNSIIGEKIYSGKVYQYKNNEAIIISVVGWIGCLIISMIYFYLNMGFNIVYILGMGFYGNIDKSITSDIALGSLYIFSYSLLPFSLVYLKIGKSKILKVVMFWMTLAVHFTMGFRFIILTYLAGIIIMYLISNNKKVKLRYIIIGLFISILLIGLLEVVRGDIRRGSGATLDMFSFKNSVESVFYNFRIYKTYYGVIKAVPNQVPYMYFDQMLIYTLVMLIPRGIWPGKPGATGIEAMRVGISEYAAAAGQAYPNLGEFYYSFGILGVVFFMFIYGRIAYYFKNKFLDRKNDIMNIMIYSLFLPANLQLLIRGYLPSNLYFVLFLLLPIVVIKKITRVSVSN